MEIVSPILVLTVLIGTFYLIYTNKMTPLKALMAASCIFLLFGIVDLNDFMMSISNPAITIIILLIIITTGIIRHYPILDYLERLLLTSKGYRPFLISSMLLTSILSAFMNNTAVVAIMTPLVHRWGHKNKVTPGKLLMPISFAAITGGMITIIGTSTTLVLNGFMLKNNIPGLDLWPLLIIGLSVTIFGATYFYFFGHRTLPSNEGLTEIVDKKRKDYLVELKVSNSSQLINKTISKAGLRKLTSFYLAEIIRKEITIAPVTPETIIEENDTLIFAGESLNFEELLKLDSGLVIPSNKSGYDEFKRFSEVVISHNSSLIGRTIKESDFRSRYDASIIAVHRLGERLRGKIGEIIIKPGDVLVVFNGSNFKEKIDVYRDLYVISDSENPVGKQPQKITPLIISGAVVLAAIFWGHIGLAITLFILFSVLFLFNIIDMRTLKRELDFNLAGILIFALLMGQAIINTGVGEMIANYVIQLSQNDPVSTLLSLIVLTAVLTTFITNVAAVTIVFPVAMTISSTFPMYGGVFFMAIAFSASAAFITPVSYQTNLMIMGPGGYKFKDFAKTGFPFTLLYLGTLFSILLLYYDMI